MMAFRPAGLSDEDTDSDDYGFFEKPVRSNPIQQHDTRKKIETNLQNAIIAGDISEFDRIITIDLNNSVNLPLDSGWTPLMHACFHAQENIVRLLLERGADPNQHADSVTPIMAACSNTSANEDIIINIVTFLIEKNCILNAGDKYGQTPLMRAIGGGRVKVVQKLLDHDANIEMRDRQGWTAVFWAAHHNQPEILEILIARGARLLEVDKSDRTPRDIAYSHDYENIVNILDKVLNPDSKDDEIDISIEQYSLSSWQDYYPGLGGKEKITYSNEISHLLYGMQCERLLPLFQKSHMDLKTFLLLDEKEMINMGIDMAYERRRLISGIRNFHLHGWKLNAVSGLYARRMENFGVLDCLTTLGAHLQQVYVLEATLQYTMREYKAIESKLKFEPPDSPVIRRLKTSAKNMLANINNIRKETSNLKTALSKISRSNPSPADYIKKKSTCDVAVGYLSEVMVFCSFIFLVYTAKNVLTDFSKK